MKIYKPIITEFSYSEKLYQEAEGLFIDRVLSTTGQEGVARVALSGGITPLPLYHKLAINPVIDWDRIELYQTDERYVAPDNKDSNQLHIQNNIREALPEIKEINFFNTQLPIDMTIKEYSEKLDTLDGNFFDFTVLGIGADGHIASLFPGGKYLKHQEETVIQTSAPRDFAIGKRISLTVESILSSSEILILLVGDNKQEALQEMLEGKKPATQFPAKFLLAHPNVRIYCCFEGN
ncbi:MAG: 6-phosphogluconolactonase [Patescibacteria group bacterium]